MAKYIEEYLVSLGFDLDSSQGKEYVQMCNDLDEKQKNLEKSGKAATDQSKKQSDAQKDKIDGNNKEINSMQGLEDATKRLKKVQEETTPEVGQPAVKKVSSKKEGSTAETTSPATEIPAKKVKKSVQNVESPASPTSETPKIESPEPVETPKVKKTTAPKKPTGEPNPKQINPSDEMLNGVKKLSSAWEQMSKGNIFGAIEQGSQGLKSLNNFIIGTEPSLKAVDSRAGSLKKTMSDLFGKSAQKDVSKTASGIESVGAETEAAAGATEGMAAAGLTAVAAVAGIAAVGVTATKAIYGMTGELAQSNIELESMAKTMWISYGSAMKLNNTLGAMGKTTADLNDIALNPTLNKQFKELQQYQETLLQQLPSDYEEVAQSRSEVDTANAKLKLTISQMDKLGKYKLSQLFDPLFIGTLDKLNAAITWINDQNNSVAKVQQEVVSVINKVTGKSSATENTSATFAPQTSSYTTSNSSSAKIDYSPEINVYPQSSDPQSIASATSSAVRSSFDEAALIKNIQGLNR